MTIPLTFGDTFALPATGDDLWHIFDARPSSYTPPENLDLPGRSIIARASSRSSFASYNVAGDWYVHESTADIGKVTAQLRALPVNLQHRTDEEWRALHFETVRLELEQALSTVGVVGFPTSPLAPHPLVSDEENIAFITAAAAAAAAKGRDAGLFDAVHATVLAHLGA